MKKIYAVTFCEYGDYFNTVVSKNNYTYPNFEHLDLKHSQFLISEDEIDHYMQYGGGIKDLVLVGYIDGDLFLSFIIRNGLNEQ